MKSLKQWQAALLVVIMFFAVSCQKSATGNKQAEESTRAAMVSRAPEANASSSVSVFATGLHNPRGLKFGPDGNLYVAEAGLGGSTITNCTQVVFPVGPYKGSLTSGRISKITPQGVRTTVTDQLPSSQANEIIGGDVEGVADVEFIGNTLYALLAGAGCSHGVESVPNGIVKINSDNTWTMVADLSAYLQSHPVAQPEEDDFEPDGTWYSMINVRGDLYALEPNHGELVKVTTGGVVSRVIDISATYGHIVPTSLTYHGNFYIGNLHPFPIPGGASKIYKVNPGGQIKIVAEGLNTVLGLVIDQQDRMYVLEMTAGAPFPTPGMGRILRIDPSGTQTVIATGLSLPTGMTMGSDGKLYVSNVGFGPFGATDGSVLQITIQN